jgi:hypothetical protein
MTKMIKMSLVAAVAVAGMTTVASAADVSYKGKLYVESFTSATTEAGKTAGSQSGQEIDFDVTATAKINDSFSAVVGVEADSENVDGKVNLGKDNEADMTEGQSMKIDDAHIAYANNGLAVKFGRQAINTPTTDGEYGEGILASYTMGNITVAAANMDNSAEFGAHDASVLAVLGSAGMVNFQLWNVAVSGINSNTTAVVGGKAGPVSIELRQANTSYANTYRAKATDTTKPKDGSTTKLVVSGKAGNVGLVGAYVSTDKDGPAFVTDDTSANTIEMTKLKGGKLADLSLVYVGATAPLSAGYSVKVDYATADFNKNDDASELRLQLNKSFAKNLKGSVQYATYEQKVDAAKKEIDFARADLTYTF